MPLENLLVYTVSKFNQTLPVLFNKKVKVNRACFPISPCKPTKAISLMQVIIVFGTERLNFFLDEDWHFDGCSGRRADGFEVHDGGEDEALQSRKKTADRHAHEHVSQCWQRSLFYYRDTFLYSTNYQDHLFACTWRVNGCFHLAGSPRTRMLP